MPLAQLLEQYISLGIFVLAAGLSVLSFLAWRRERDSRMWIVTLGYAMFAVYGLIVFLEYPLLPYFPYASSHGRSALDNRTQRPPRQGTIDRLVASFEARRGRPRHERTRRPKRGLRGQRSRSRQVPLHGSPALVHRQSRRPYPRPLGQLLTRGRVRRNPSKHQQTQQEYVHEKRHGGSQQRTDESRQISPDRCSMDCPEREPSICE